MNRLVSAQPFTMPAVVITLLSLPVERGIVFNGRATAFPKAPPRDVLDIPKAKSDFAEMKREFFRVITDPRAYHTKQK